MTSFYEKSGVSIARGDEASADAFKQLQATFNANTVLSGNVVGLRVDLSSIKDPLFGIAVDGVGTKLKYAFAADKHDTVGIDLVAMCVNDLVRNNIKPLGFGMYRATGRIYPETMSEVVKGVVAGCLEAGCVYQSGETAEMPELYQAGEYDLAGFAWGVYEADDFIDGSKIEPGDVLFALPSSGLHSNGFSAVRKLFSDREVAFDQELIAKLLTPTRIYVNQVLDINSRFPIYGWAHITGEGITGKLGKILPEGVQARINTNTWDRDPIFAEIQEKSRVNDLEMYSTFNMGLGMIGVASSTTVRKLVDYLAAQGQQIFVVGSVELAQQQGDKIVLSELRDY